MVFEDPARGVRPALLAVLVLTSLLAFAGNAEARDGGWLKAMNISPQIASDGDRYLAFQLRDKEPVILDTWTGKRTAIRNAWLCQPRDIGGGRVLLICPHVEGDRHDTGFRARVADLKTGRSFPLKKSKRIFDAYEIGRYWVGISTNPYPWGSYFTRFLNWRTGVRKSVKALEYPSGVSLDHPTLAPGDTATFTPDFRGYPNPFFGEPILCRGTDVVLSDWKNQFRLWFDEKHSVKLGRSGVFAYEQRCQWYQSVRIGRNWVTWRRHHTAHGYNFRTGQRFSRTYKVSPLITPVRDGVAVALETGKFGRYYKAFRIKVIRLGGGGS